MDVEVNVDTHGHFGCLRGVSTSVQVLLHGKTQFWY